MEPLSKQTMLGEGKISTLLWKFSLPGIIGMLVSSLYNIIDRIFVGNGVNSWALGGVTVSFPIQIISMAFGMLVGVGASALISIALGEGRQDRAEKLLAHAFMLNAVIGVGVTVFGLLFLDPLLHIFGATPDIFPYAKTYTSIVLWGNVFSSLSFGMNGVIRAEGSPHIAMMTMFISGAIHIAFDYVFIFIMGMGVEGAAYSTVISQVVCTVWVVHFFTRNKNATIQLHRGCFQFDRDTTERILRLGMAPFFLQLAQVVVFILSNQSIRHYAGADAGIMIAAVGAANSVMSLIMMPLLGISQGAQPIIGYNYGAKRYDRVRETTKLALLWATSLSLFSYVIIFVFPAQVISLFNPNDQQLISLGARIMLLSNLLFPGIAVGVIGSQYFQAVNKPMEAIFLSLSRQFIFLVPAMLILPLFRGVEGIFSSFVVADGAAIFLTALFLSREFKRMPDRAELIAEKV